MVSVEISTAFTGIFTQKLALAWSGHCHEEFNVHDGKVGWADFSTIHLGASALPSVVAEISPCGSPSSLGLASRRPK